MTKTPQRIYLNTLKGQYLLNPDEIIRLEANSNYTYIHFCNQTRILASKVLKEFCDALEPIGFIRTHRTHLVNANYIHSLTPDGSIRMSDTSVAEVSRRKKPYLKKKLQLHFQ